VIKVPTIDQQITFLYTADLDATARFYEDVMGLSLALDQGACRIYHVCGDAYLGFCYREDALKPSSSVILTLVSLDVDGWYRALCARGVAFDRAPALNERYHIYHCFLRDPSGYVSEILHFLDPAWPGASLSNPS